MKTKCPAWAIVLIAALLAMLAMLIIGQRNQPVQLTPEPQPPIHTEATK